MWKDCKMYIATFIIAGTKDKCKSKLDFLTGKTKGNFRSDIAKASTQPPARKTPSKSSTKKTSTQQSFQNAYTEKSSASNSVPNSTIERLECSLKERDQLNAEQSLKIKRLTKENASLSSDQPSLVNDLTLWKIKLVRKNSMIYLESGRKKPINRLNWHQPFSCKEPPMGNIYLKMIKYFTLHLAHYTQITSIMSFATMN